MLVRSRSDVARSDIIPPALQCSLLHASLTMQVLRYPQSKDGCPVRDHRQVVLQRACSTGRNLCHTASGAWALQGSALAPAVAPRKHNSRVLPFWLPQHLLPWLCAGERGRHNRPTRSCWCAVWRNALKCDCYSLASPPTAHPRNALGTICCRAAAQSFRVCAAMTYTEPM
jgi:hypothetical protein